jgi:nucleoid-associated protein YgaU
MAVSNAMQIGAGIVAAGAVAITVVVIAPLLTPTKAPAPFVAEANVEAPTSIAGEIPLETPAVIMPKLDTFRVESDGRTVFAGRAASNQTVDILLDGIPIERVIADASGAFVAFPQLPYSDNSQAVSLMADPEGAATLSAETYLIAPIFAPVVAATAPVVAPDPVPVPEVAIAAEAAEPVIQPEAIDPVAEPDVIAPQVTPEIDPIAPDPSTKPALIDIPVPQPNPEPPSETPTAPAILVATAEGVEVIQPVISDVSPEVLANVALDSITYDPSGEVLIAGRAAGEGFVQVYLDNQPITTSRIVAGGTWRTDLPNIDTGIYTLRIDEVDTTGEVVSRIETPFKREEPDVVAAALAEDVAKPDFQVAMMTVQPGTTLWAIARDRFGSGVMYVEVFEANRDRIRNPDLIYPGQVFRMPEGDQ